MAREIEIGTFNLKKERKKKKKKNPSEHTDPVIVSSCEKGLGVCSCNVLGSPLEFYSCPLSFLQAEYETFCMCFPYAVGNKVSYGR